MHLYFIYVILKKGKNCFTLKNKKMDWMNDLFEFFDLVGIWPTDLLTEEELSLLGSFSLLPKHFSRAGRGELIAPFLSSKETVSIQDFLYEDPPDEFERRR